MFEALILSLRLPVDLRVERRAQFSFYSKVVAQLWSERTRKDGALIGNNALWRSELRYNTF
jgi:hypothetical protein